MDLFCVYDEFYEKKLTQFQKKMKDTVLEVIPKIENLVIQMVANHEEISGMTRTLIRKTEIHENTSRMVSAHFYKEIEDLKKQVRDLTVDVSELQKSWFEVGSEIIKDYFEMDFAPTAPWIASGALLIGFLSYFAHDTDPYL